MSTIRSAALTAALLLTPTAAAWAQGYTVTPAGGRIEARPADAAGVDVDSVRPERASALVRLPFEFWYYGTRCSTAVVSAHGWLLPGAKEGFTGAADPAAPHGQDATTGAFPYTGGTLPRGAGADGVVAPMWATLAAVNDGSAGAGQVLTWTSGTAPRRRFVVSWDRVAVGSAEAGVRLTIQVQLHEGTGAIVFAYAAQTVTGRSTPPANFVCGLDAPADARFTAPLAPTAKNAGTPPSDFVFVPRTVHFNSPDAQEVGVPVTWQRIPRESLRGADGADSCCYVAAGTAWFSAPDRVTRSKPARAKELAAEDRATFPGIGGPPDGASTRPAAGDTERWVRQVLDGKVVLLPNDGGAPVRLWLRVTEWFTLDDRGLAGRDDHVWNLRIFLSMAFPENDPRSKIENYSAWRATAEATLTVVKLFDASQGDDAGRQFDTGRTNEDANWCARIRAGHRGPMPSMDCPEAGWTRFPMKDRGETIVQHADRRDLRDVPDPNYVASGYSYVVRSADGTDWVSRRGRPPASFTDETFEVDPPDATALPGGR